MTSLRKIHCAVAGFVMAIALGTGAQAANVFMLQFGSYQSADEANAHLTELNNKHPGALSRLTTSVRTVSLPPDNLTVYRTQAGPLASRADAQAVCSQLASNGDECYVVETAMAQVAAASTPAAAPATNAASPTAVSAAPTALAPKTATAASPASSVQTITLSDAEDAAPTTPSSTGNVSAEQAAAAEASVRKALDDAATKQTADASAPPAAPKPKPHPSFWEQLNPFSDDTTDTASNTAVPAKAATVTAAPIEPIFTESTSAPTETVPPGPTPSHTIIVTKAGAPPPSIDIVATPPVTPPKAVTIVSQPTPPAPAATATTASTTNVFVPAAPAPLVAPAAASSPVTSLNAPAPLGNVPPATTATPVIVTAAAPNFPLPPPPAPLRSAAAAPTTTIAPAMQVAVASLPAPNANVKVEEAKRVPLVQTNYSPAPAAPITPTNPAFAQIPSVDLSPSSTLGQRTLWAQIGRFGSAQAALAYWANYRQLHPDFPVVRVRVTTPVAAQQHGMTEANLRVGPFARPEFITILCKSLTPPDQAPPEGMQCGAVTDLGVAVTPYGPSSGYLGASRYDR